MDHIHYLKGKTELRDRIVIRNLVTMYYFEFAKDYCFNGERHNFWELVYVDKGSVMVTADERTYELTSGMITFHQPNEFHSFYASAGSAPNIVVITFYAESDQMSPFVGRTIQLDDHSRNLLAQVVKEGKAAFEFPFSFPLRRKANAPIGCEQSLRIYLELLLLTLLPKLDQQKASPPLHTLAKDKEQHMMSQAVILFMERHIGELLTIGEISDEFHIAKTKLKETFKHETGDSVISYFIRMKIEHAKSLIREDTLNLSEIAQKLGFSSSHYFSRTFKKLTGLSPSEYARSVKARTEV